MKVALLGAPGVGKTRLAKRVSRRLNGDPEWLSGSWKVTDGYVDKLAKRVGHDFGPIFDRTAYRCNLQVLTERWLQEDEARFRGYNTITCGTIFETIIYAAAQSIPIGRLPEDLMMEETYIAETMMSGLSLLATITFDYDALFYLPLTSESASDWSEVVDAKLEEVLGALFKVALVVNGTDKEKTEYVTRTIKTIAASTAHEQQAVRSGQELSPGEEPQSEDLPHLPEPV